MTLSTIRAMRQSAIDCNNDTIPDPLDIKTGVSRDLDSNGRPDECDGDSAAVALRLRAARALWLHAVRSGSDGRQLVAEFRALVPRGRVRLTVYDDRGVSIRSRCYPASAQVRRVEWQLPESPRPAGPGPPLMVVLKVDSLAIGRRVADGR